MFCRKSVRAILQRVASPEIPGLSLSLSSRGNVGTPLTFDWYLHFAHLEHLKPFGIEVTMLGMTRPPRKTSSSSLLSFLGIAGESQRLFFLIFLCCRPFFL